MRLALVFVWLCGSAALFGGPVSPYYVTAGNQSRNWVLQGGSVVNSWNQACSPCGTGDPYALTGEFALVVANGSVKQLANGDAGWFDSYYDGSQYTLAGTFTGTRYAYPVRYAGFYDGATDGVHNYSIDFIGGGVYRFNSDWAHPVKLFDTEPYMLGITYDPWNGTLWISDWLTGTVEQRSMSGAVISSFNARFASITALAMDYADQTLWMGSQQDKGRFSNFDRSGTALASETYAPLIDQNTLGGEFNYVPEPASAALAGIASAVFFLFRFRSKARG